MSRPDLRAVWRSADAATERDMLAFWRKWRLLPDEADAGQRLKELCVVACADGEIIGAVTATIRQIDFLRARFVVIRVAAPGARATGRLQIFPARMVLLAQKTLEQWSLAHPEEKVMGVAGLVAPKTYRMMDRPICVPVGLL